MTRLPAIQAPVEELGREGEAGLDAVLAGDRAARSAFVERFARLVYAVIERTLRHHHARDHADLVEDLFAEVFVALFDRDARRLRQWTGGCSLASWVRLVSVSVTIDRLRRDRGDDDRRERLPALISEGPAALELLLHAEQLAALGRALARLSESNRALLTALFVDELEAAEVAGRLGIAAGTLYTRKNRALTRLRQALAAVMAEGL